LGLIWEKTTEKNEEYGLIGYWIACIAYKLRTEHELLEYGCVVDI
jgi:hypothetical protein